jgi:hypothetical protein
VPFNTPALNAMLDALDDTGAFPISFVGIHQLTTAPGSGDGTPGIGTNANTGVSPEATGGSPAYARLAVVLAAAASGQKTGSSGTLTFDVPAGTYAFFGLYNHLTTNTNNYRGFIPFGGASAIKGFATVDPTLTNDQFFCVAHGMADNDRVILSPVFGETIPTGLTEGAVYFVVASAANTFKVALTQGGAAVDITATGGGEIFWQRVVPEIFGAQGQITVAANQLVLDVTGT